MFLGHEDSRFLSPVVFSFLVLSSFFSHTFCGGSNSEQAEIDAQVITAKAVVNAEKETLDIATELPIQESTNTLIYDSIAKENLKTLTSLEVDIKASEHQTDQVYKKWHEVLKDTLDRHL